MNFDLNWKNLPRIKPSRSFTNLEEKIFVDSSFVKLVRICRELDTGLEIKTDGTHLKRQWLLTPVKSNIYTKCHGNDGTSRVEECRFIVLHVCSCTLLECEKNHQKFLGSMVPFRWEKQHHAWLSIQFTIDKRGCSQLYFLVVFCRNSIGKEVAIKLQQLQLRKHKTLLCFYMILAGFFSSEVIGRI